MSLDICFGWKSVVRPNSISSSQLDGEERGQDGDATSSQSPGIDSSHINSVTAR